MTAMSEIDAIETATLDNLVVTTRLADGVIVSLPPRVGAEQVASLRLALLMPLPDDCRDVVVDAGRVQSVETPALAVLFAAWAWTEEHDRRFLVSCTSDGFDTALAHHGVADELPRLTPLTTAPREVVLPQQRVSVD